MAMRNHNLVGNNAGAAAHLLLQAREDVSSALLGVGFLTCATAVRAAASGPPADSVLPYPVYHGALAGAFIGGVVAMWAAGWVADDAVRRRATGRVILYASLVPLVVAVGLGKDSDLSFDILRAAA